MPRKPRIISSTGIYHIILRSVNQQIIFEEDSDFQKFLFILSDCKSKYDVDIFAYCLMSNHIHLLLRSDSDTLSHFFLSLGTRFARWYNDKYTRYGHLFQERYHSKPVEDEAYFITSFLYIHNNPVKAGFCLSASEYRWSSYNAFFGEENAIINLSFPYNVFGDAENLQRLLSANKVSNTDITDLDEFDSISSDHRLTNEKAIEKFKDISSLNNPFEIVNLPRNTRNQLLQKLRQNGLSINQIARITGISSSTVKRVNREA